MKTNQKLRTAVWYYYRRALPALLICTGLSLAFGLITASENGLSGLTMVGVNGRIFWMLFMLFSAKSLDNVFLQTSISRKTQYKALLGFLPFSVLAAMVNMLLVYISTLLYNAMMEEQLKPLSAIPKEDFPFSIFYHTNGFSEDAAALPLLLLALALSTLKILRGMVFGVLLAKLLRKLSQQKLSKPIILLIVGGVIALLLMISIIGDAGLSTLGTGIYYFVCTVFFGNGGASATLSVLIADIMMLCIYLLLLRLCDGAGHLQKKRVVRNCVSIAVLLVLGVLNTCLCTPAAVNLLECQPVKYYDTETGEERKIYNYKPSVNAFRLLNLQRKFATLTYKQNLDWHLFRFYYMTPMIDDYMSQRVPDYESTAVDYVNYADGAALLDDMLAHQLRTDYYNALPVISPAGNAFNQNGVPLYDPNKNLLRAAMAYHCINGNFERGVQIFEEGMANDDLTNFNTIEKYGKLLQEFFAEDAAVSAWAAEQYDFLADICIQYAEALESAPEWDIYAVRTWRDTAEEYRTNADLLRAGEPIGSGFVDLYA